MEKDKEKDKESDSKSGKWYEEDEDEEKDEDEENNNKRTKNKEGDVSEGEGDEEKNEEEQDEEDEEKEGKDKNKKSSAKISIMESHYKNELKRYEEVNQELQKTMENKEKHISELLKQIDDIKKSKSRLEEESKSTNALVQQIIDENTQQMQQTERSLRSKFNKDISDIKMKNDETAAILANKIKREKELEEQINKQKMAAKEIEVKYKTSEEKLSREIELKTSCINKINILKEKLKPKVWMPSDLDNIHWSNKNHDDKDSKDSGDKKDDDDEKENKGDKSSSDIELDIDFSDENNSKDEKDSGDKKDNKIDIYDYTYDEDEKVLSCTPLYVNDNSGAFTWQYVGDTGTYVNVAKDYNSIIENKYLEFVKYPSVAGTGAFTLASGDYIYNVSFINMSQTNISTGKVRRIKRTGGVSRRRIDPNFIPCIPTVIKRGIKIVGQLARSRSIPSTSRDIKDIKDTKTVNPLDPITTELSSSDAEYIEVSKQFLNGTETSIGKLSTISTLKIIKIERVCNPILYENWSLRRMQLIKSGKNPGEIMLWHASIKDPTSENILREGLDNRLSKNGYWGKGLYGAFSSQYSYMGYTASTPIKTILYVLFLTGSSLTVFDDYRSSELTREPKDEVTGKYYDSIAGCVDQNSLVYAVYNPSSVYPLYRVTYST